jgi:hypothetical protein
MHGIKKSKLVFNIERKKKLQLEKKKKKKIQREKKVLTGSLQRNGSIFKVEKKLFQFIIIINT